MGNCLPKLRKKNKVYPDTRVSVSKKKDTNVSDILSRSSASLRASSSRSRNCEEEEVEMVKELTMSDVDSTSVESVPLDKEIRVLDQLKETAQPAVIKKPVFFQVDFVQGMPHRMPSRLAERMKHKVVVKTSEHLALTEEDEILMNEIMEEVEAKEKREELAEQQLTAQNLREQYLQSIREKARGMKSWPQTRVRIPPDAVCISAMYLLRTFMYVRPFGSPVNMSYTFNTTSKMVAWIRRNEPPTKHTE